MTQNLKDLYQSLDRNLASIANKENMDARDLEMAEHAVCTMEKIKKIESMPHEEDRYSGRYGYGYDVSYPGHQQWPMSYGDESYRRGRNAMGQFTSNDSRPMMGDNYSGHSFNDRLIANLESMMAEAPSEEDRMKLHEEIDRLRRNPR